MAASDYLQMPEDELAEKVTDLRKSLWNLRVRNTTKELENTSQIRMEKKELARVLTALSERRRAADKEAKEAK